MTTLLACKRVAKKSILRTADLGAVPTVAMELILSDYIDSLTVEFSSAAVATGKLALSLHRGDGSGEIIPVFLDDVDISSAVATSTDILKVNTSIKDATGSGTRLDLHRLQSVLRWVRANKTSGHSIAERDTRASSMFLMATVSAGTIPADYEIYFKAICSTAT